jgi:hypothetical protein
MHLTQISYVRNVWYNIKNKHIACTVNKYILIQVMMENNGFYVMNAKDGYTVNAPIMIQIMIHNLNA